MEASKQCCCMPLGTVIVFAQVATTFMEKKGHEMGSATASPLVGDSREAVPQPADYGSGTGPRVLTPDQHDRALGCLIGAATGDALGAPYEFEPPIAASEDVGMIGGGQLNWEPGEWTDDTAMSIVVLQVAAEPGLGECLTSRASLDAIAAGWSQWARVTPDIGLLTAEVIGRAHELAAADGRSVPTGEDMTTAARHAWEARPKSAGNGGLMRCYSVVLAMLQAPKVEFLQALSVVNRMTHADEDTVEAALVWGLMLRHAILTGEIDVWVGLEVLPVERRDAWENIIGEALSAPPCYFNRNGWVQHAFQAALAAVREAGPVPVEKFERRAYFSRVLDGAVRAGYDTDTVASIAGSLAGAALGYKSVDPAWRRELHGWPGLTVKELLALGESVLARTSAS